MKKYIKERIIKQICHDELDLSTVDELMDTFDDYDYEFIPDRKSEINWNHGDYISIDRLISVVNKMKNQKDVTHVQIFYHNDHHGYYFTGVNLKLLSEDNEEAKELKKQLLKEEISIRKSRYEANLHSLELDADNINKLEQELDNLENDEE